MVKNKINLPYTPTTQFDRKVAYFSMEFAIDQSLKIYSGGLGFLAGSHMRSAYSLKQNLIGIGILWKFGYYDQGREIDQTLRVDWEMKFYHFLEDTGIQFQIPIHGAPVTVKVYYLPPDTFGSAPLYLLTTDVYENNELAKSISYRLYDNNPDTKLAQYILLGAGGARLVDELDFQPDVYHLNEAHGLPAAFYLYQKFEKQKQNLSDHLVFTTHTPEEAGNEKYPFAKCLDMGFFSGLSEEEVRSVTDISDDQFNLSLAALRLARKANGVSRLHGEVSRAMWQKYEGICEIDHITNAQNYDYWADKQLYQYRQESNTEAILTRKKELKKEAFSIVADQTGRLFSPDVLTIVWARRFAGYKRAGFLLRDKARFEKLVRNTEFPVQIIWAGKPYPFDFENIATFDYLVNMSHFYPNVSVVTGYELALSKKLKAAADVWLNNPRVPREASGTSGMTAAMNGALNFSTDDGWIPEFIKPGENGFLIPQADYHQLSVEEQDQQDFDHLYTILEQQILPTYYKDKPRWAQMIGQSMDDVRKEFNSDRMATEYYERLYSPS